MLEWIYPVSYQPMAIKYAEGEMGGRVRTLDWSEITDGENSKNYLGSGGA